MANAYDFLGHEDNAIPLYEEAIRIGLNAEYEAYALLQLGSSLRNVGPGWRVGFLFAPKNIAKHLVKVHQYNVSCATTISQKATFEALTNGQDDAIMMKDIYKERMEYVYDRLVQMGIETVKPNGAFYFFPSIEKFDLSSFDFSVGLLKEAPSGCCSWGCLS